LLASFFDFAGRQKLGAFFIQRGVLVIGGVFCGEKTAKIIGIERKTPADNRQIVVVDSVDAEKKIVRGDDLCGEGEAKFLCRVRDLGCDFRAG